MDNAECSTNCSENCSFIEIGRKATSVSHGRKSQKLGARLFARVTEVDSAGRLLHHPHRSLVNPSSARILETRDIQDLPSEILINIFKYTTLEDTLAVIKAIKAIKLNVPGFNDNLSDILSCREVLDAQMVNSGCWGRLPKLLGISVPVIDNPALIDRLREQTGSDLSGKPKLQQVFARYYDLAPEMCTHKLTGHRGAVHSVAVLSDGRVASASEDRTLRVWDITRPQRQQCITVLKGHTRGVNGIVVLPDDRLVSASSDKTLKVWDLTRPDGKQCIKTLKGHKDSVTCLIVLPDERLVSGSADSTLKVWDLTRSDRKQCVVTLKHSSSKSERVNAVVQLPGGYVVSSGTSIISIWDLTKSYDDCLIDELPGANSSADTIAVLPDGRFISLFGQTLGVWNALNDCSCSSRTCGFTYDPYDGPYCSVGALPDGRVIASTNEGEYGKLHIWEVEHGGMRCRRTHRLGRHKHVSVGFAFCQDGRMVCAGDDGNVTVWNYCPSAQIEAYLNRLKFPHRKYPEPDILPDDLLPGKKIGPGSNELGPVTEGSSA